MADFTAGSVLTAAQLDTAFNTLTERVVTDTTATLGAADAGELLSVNNNSGGTVTIPLNSTWAAETGTHTTILNAGTAGTWTLGTAVGVTLEGTVTTLAPGAALMALKRGTNTWRSVPFSSGSAGAVSGTTGSPTTVTAGGKTRYTFTSSGDITVSVAGTFEVLVCGGGSAGRQTGTAGGGGMVFAGFITLAVGTHTVTVGAGLASTTAGDRAGFSLIGTAVTAGGGINADTAAGRSNYEGAGAGGGGGSASAGSGTTGGNGVTSTLGDGVTSVEYGAGGDWGAAVVGTANTGKGGDAVNATSSQNGASGVVIIAVG